MSTQRVLVVVEVALRKFVIGLAQAGAVVIFVILCAMLNANPTQVAELYVVVCGGFLLLSGVASLLLITVTPAATQVAAS